MFPVAEVVAACQAEATSTADQAAEDERAGDDSTITVLYSYIAVDGAYRFSWPAALTRAAR